MPGTPDAPDAAELRAENGRLREALERLGLLNEDKDAVIADLRALVERQAEQIARLERIISRNSGNSSMPPSTDDQPGKKPPKPKPAGARKRRPGKQPGAAGAFLAWNDHPDQARDLFPEGSCGCCGADLALARDLGVRYSHQVTDLPGARARTTQYDEHEVECACGCRHLAAAPAEAGGAAPGTVTYGLGLQAWCVFLMVMHHVPVERCADIIESMSGTRPSDGWVHALLARAAKAVAAAGRVIRSLIVAARVICGDETPVRAGPGPKSKKMYLQVACTSLLTYYFLGGRDLPSFRDFIYSDLHGTVIVHDRYVNYDHFDGVVHQLRTAHLLRDVEDAAQACPDAHWPARSPANCAPSSTRRTSPATPAWPPSPRTRSASTGGCSATPSTWACPRSAASPAAPRSGSRPACSCWNASSTARTTCCGSSPTPPSRPPPTRPNATCAPPRPSSSDGLRAAVPA